MRHDDDTALGYDDARASASATPEADYGRTD